MVRIKKIPDNLELSKIAKDQRLLIDINYHIIIHEHGGENVLQSQICHRALLIIAKSNSSICLSKTNTREKIQTLGGKRLCPLVRGRKFNVPCNII